MASRNNEITNQTLHAQRLNILYEDSFAAALRKIATINHTKWWLIAIFPFLFYILGVMVGLDYIFISPLAIGIALLLILLKKYYKPQLEEIPMVGIENGGDDPYYLHLGDATRKIELIRDAANVKKKNPEVLEYPVLIDFDIALRHMFVVGTTGSGKTTFLIFLLQQHLEMGGGAIIVDGKGDKDIYTDVYNTCVHTNREDDFYVINFNVPKESNTMNPLLSGDTDEIIDVIGNMLETGGDNAFWAGRALSMMKGLLSLLVPLRDCEMLYDPGSSKIPSACTNEPIFTFKVLNKFLDLEAMRNLYFYIKDLNTKPTQDWIATDVSRMEAYLSSCSVPLSDPKAKLSDGMSKMHGNSNTMWGEALDLFMGTFGDIFNTDAPDIDMNDIVINSRILYILLPATKKDPRTLSMLGKIVLAFFKSSVASLLGDKISGTIEQRMASSAIRPKVPFWGVMDEYGAYATEGFDNVLAQARSLRVTISIMVQETASLEKGSLIDKKRLLGNTGLKVFLKIEESDTVKEVIEFFGDEEQATVKYQNENAEDFTFDVQRKPLITPNMLKDMGGGHGYVAFSGHITPMLCGYYKPPNARKILEFSAFRITTMQNHEFRKSVEAIKKTEFKDENNDISTDKKLEQIDNLTKSLRRNDEAMIELYGETISDKIGLINIINSIEEMDNNYEAIDFELVQNRMEDILSEMEYITNDNDESKNEDNYDDDNGEIHYKDNSKEMYSGKDLINDLKGKSKNEDDAESYDENEEKNYI